MIEYVALGLGLIYIGFLIYEKISLVRQRQRIPHVIHVNGIRGKSTVTRLIGAVLRDAGYKTMTKVTGTKPIIIDPFGNEIPIRRLGPANIREQIKMVRLAAKYGADILVIECMAIKKEYQAVTQNNMLNADIGIITNVRKDHQEEFGHSMESIVEALAETIPAKGRLYVFEETQNQFEKHIENKQAEVRIVSHFEGDETIDFYPENIAIALRIASDFGIAKEDALASMRRYHRDIGSLSIYHWDDTYLVNGFAINDVDSLHHTYVRLQSLSVLKGRDVTILLNNRIDRPRRAMEHIEFLKKIQPRKVMVVGGFYRQVKAALDQTEVTPYHHSAQLDQPYVFAIGNIRKYGYQVIRYAEAKGTKYYG
ncbi:MAG: poly-gamma-glutamate synthase PgsB [Candidatus Izemoplasmatales bacterium]|jgi:poly-gamma-glutamate synthase PgsB/CapB|nr:poly-gamma-glutamate synthase PgsB [Candidatus Izemoplasmatales bacterium]MDD5293102.1 poly-gamma-glutamate synthase PgsB [Candidatus Izemoplasmatales bacterium]